MPTCANEIKKNKQTGQCYRMKQKKLFTFSMKNNNTKAKIFLDIRKQRKNRLCLEINLRNKKNISNFTSKTSLLLIKICLTMPYKKRTKYCICDYIPFLILLFLGISFILSSLKGFYGILNLTIVRQN